MLVKLRLSFGRQLVYLHVMTVYKLVAFSGKP